MEWFWLKKKPAELNGKDRFDQRIIDSLKVDMHIMHEKNAETFKQFKSIKPEQVLDYSEFAGKDKEHVRTFTVIFYPSTYKPESQTRNALYDAQIFR